MVFSKKVGEIIKKKIGYKFYTYVKKIYHVFEKLFEKPKFRHFYLSIFEKIYLKIFKNSYKIYGDLNLNINIFKKHNLDIVKCKNTLSKNNLDFYSEKLSWHFHFFSSIVDKDLKILEIGTHNGEFQSIYLIIYLTAKYIQ